LADTQLGRRQSGEARNASSVADACSRRAEQLEASAREQEAHQARIGHVTGELISAVAATFIEALGMDAPARRVWGVLLQQAAEGEELAAPEEDVEAVRGALTRDARAAVLLEMREREERNQAERRALPPGEDDEDDDQEEPVAAVGEPEDAEVVNGELAEASEAGR
jgi:hypothetical protein